MSVIVIKYRPSLAAALTLLALAIGCGRNEPKPRLIREQTLSSTTYPVKGVVRKVDAATGEVTLSHDEIVGFMPKMTMPFAVQNPAVLEGVEIGDEVEGMIQVDRSQGEIQSLKVTELVIVKPATSLAPATPLASETPPGILQVGEQVPDFSMTTQEGKPLKLADLRGKVVVLSFIYTRCPSPEYCPAIDGKFADLARRVGAVADRAEKVRLLSVSFDPEHDTPQVLAAHAARRGAKPPLWTFAVTSHEELSKVAGPLGLTYVPGTREINHNLRTAVIGADGKLAGVENGSGWSPAELARTLNSLVRDAGK